MLKLDRFLVNKGNFFFTVFQKLRSFLDEIFSCDFGRFLGEEIVESIVICSVYFCGFLYVQILDGGSREVSCFIVYVFCNLNENVLVILWRKESIKVGLLLRVLFGLFVELDLGWIFFVLDQTGFFQFMLFFLYIFLFVLNSKGFVSDKMQFINSIINLGVIVEEFY